MSALASSPLRRLVQLTEEHPEWWVLPVSAAGWAAMGPHLMGTGASCHQVSFWADWRSWCLMVVAMMLPLMIESVRWVADRSFRSRQGRAMLSYVAGYLAAWAMAGLGVSWLLGFSWTHATWLPAAAFGLAAIWSLSPVYSWLMTRSHAVIPLAPSGWRADRDCLRLGMFQALPCLGTCGLLMIGCTLTGHGLVAMVGGAALGASERFSWRARPWLVPVGAVALAVWYGLQA